MRLATTLTAVFFTLNLYSQNPMATFYNGPEGYPAWTDEIKWNNVLDMSTFSRGSHDFTRFENARDSLYNMGGGVLYYPAGTYDFRRAPSDGPDGRGLMLRSGVVIVGEAPEGDSIAVDGEIDLPVKFIFEFREMGNSGSEGEVSDEWNLIGCIPSGDEELKDVKNVGIAWVELEGAIVYFGPQMTWGDTYANAGAWRSSKVMGEWQDRVPDGTYPMDPFCGSPMNTGLYEGAGSGRFVFGCKIVNASLPNMFIDEGFGNGGFFVQKFSGRITIYGSQVFIANNALTRPDKCFLYGQATSEGYKQIIYDYGFTMGIDVNKDYCNINANKLDQSSGGYWPHGVVIKDNYIYNHGNKGLEVSGTWVTIKNNFNDRDYLEPGGDVYGITDDWTLTINGYKTHQDNGSSDGFLNRGFDLAGKALWVDGNSYNNVGTPYPSNDGEGILCQAHGGTQIHSWAMTNNNGYDNKGKGYIGGYDVHNYGCFGAWNNTESWVGGTSVGARDFIDCAFVDNNAEENKVNTGGGIDDAIIICPPGAPSPPTSVTAEFKKLGGKYVEIEWEDNSNNEVAFRVDRKITAEGEWYTIAYRPRHSTGHEENEQAWHDYMAPVGVPLYYRVVAVNCDDTDAGASDTTAALIIPGTVLPPEFSLPGGIYDTIVTVELSCATSGAMIFYTLDGSDPTTGSTPYGGTPIVVDETSAIKAIAVKPGWNNSNVAEANYVSTVGIMNQDAGNLNLYPNPASDVLQIEWSHSFVGRVELTVFDFSGRITLKNIRTKYDSELREQVRISGLAPGHYYLGLRAGNMNLMNSFVVIEK